MRQVIDEQNYKTVKTLLGAGLKVTQICEITQISSVVVYRIKNSVNYEEFDAERKRRYVEAQMARDKEQNAGNEPKVQVSHKTTEPVPTTAHDLVQAVTRVAIALEKNNDLMSDIYEKIGDCQVSLQELVSAWQSNN